MRLRKLQLKDAMRMHEWMGDENVIRYLYSDFKTKTIEDCIEFINNSSNSNNNLHFAIASDEDDYMGTVSLKNINKTYGYAEMSVVVRSDAMKKGYAWFGVEEILKKAISEYNLECVYWCVSKHDLRTIRFYDKHNFHEAVDVLPEILDRYSRTKSLKWYSFLKGDVIEDRNEVAGCRIVRIKTIPTINAGELSFFEAQKDFPFEIKRIYYISKVPEGIRRGFHAHKKLKQMLFCPFGRIQLILENSEKREEIELSDPSIGVVIENTIWREMLWLQKDSVLCVVASDYYDANDYIRDYDEFKKYLCIDK